MRVQPIIAAAALLLFVGQAKAGTIPYSNIGTIAPTNSFTASTTGSVYGYFVSGGEAGDTDYIQMLDLTNPSADQGFLFNNHATAVGTEAFFGDVTAGDVLEFQLENVSLGDIILSSIPADSADGVNHAYSTAWGGGILNGASIPAGTYVGMEDEPASFSDFNYNDDSFVFTDVSAYTATPEPDSIYLLGTGLLSLAGIARRKLRRGVVVSSSL